MDETTEATTKVEEKTVIPQPIDTSKPKPPYKALFKIQENMVRCSMCGLPGGKLSFLDQNMQRWEVKASTNLIKRPDGFYVHQNSSICSTGKDFSFS